MRNIAALMVLPIGGGSLDLPRPAASATDIIGIYFDQEVENHCVDLPTGIHHAYLIASNLNAESGMSGWECQILNDGPLTVMEWNLEWQAINVYPPPGFGVGFTTPMPRVASMVLLDIRFLLFDTQPAYFYVQPWVLPSLADVPVYATGGDPGDLRPLHQSTGGPTFPSQLSTATAPSPQRPGPGGG